MHKLINEWWAAFAGAILAFFAVRSGYLSLIKELSVGKSALNRVKKELKEKDDRIRELESELATTKRSCEDSAHRLKRLELEADEQYEEMKIMARGMREMKEIMVIKSAV